MANMNQELPNNLLTRNHLMDRLQLSKNTIRKFERMGMPVIHIGQLPRYNYEEVMDWLKKMEETEK